MYLLDSDLEQNDERDRRLTDWLYGGDARYRLAQLALLRIGAALTLVRDLGEGRRPHLPSQRRLLGAARLPAARKIDCAWARRPKGSKTIWPRCGGAASLTTHTLIPAGHDRFPFDMVRDVLGERRRGAVARAGRFALRRRS